MPWRDFFTIKKSDAATNNYKLALFNQVSNSTEVMNMSAIKRYFNSLYGDNMSNGFSAFSVGSSIKDTYVSEDHNKAGRLLDYRGMANDDTVGRCLDTMCYSADIPDENNELFQIKIEGDGLDAEDVGRIHDTVKEYLDLFDFDTNFDEYFRIFLIEGQLCWENIVAKDDLEQGIIGVNFIPNDAYDFCYDMETREKMGIMITNSTADSGAGMYTLNGLRTMNPGAGYVSNKYRNLNCYDELMENKCIVMPWEQLTYSDSRNVWIG